MLTKVMKSLAAKYNAKVAAAAAVPDGDGGDSGQEWVVETDGSSIRRQDANSTVFEVLRCVFPPGERLNRRDALLQGALALGSSSSNSRGALSTDSNDDEVMSSCLLVCYCFY
jgi:hypothetical protein